MPLMITLGQLSDVHLAPVPAPRLTGLNAKQALGWINWQRKRKAHHVRAVLDAVVADLKGQHVDHLAVTGDLVNIGLPDEQALALTWLKSLGSPETVTALPGNHDVYGVRPADPGIERWRPYMTGNWGEARSSFPFVKTIGPIALIGVSSAVPTPLFFATGELGQIQRDALERTLVALKQAGVLRVLLIHHPPLPGQADRLRRLNDSPQLTALLARAGAELVLHGHNHRPMYAETPGPQGPIPVVGAPSASALPGQHEPGAGYNLLRLSIEGAHCHIHLTRRTYQPDGTISTTEQRRLAG